MIDDITVAARLDDIEGVPFGMLQLKTVVGRPDTFGVACDDGRLFVTFCPSTKVATVRISVPRWLHKGPVNFPLRRIRGVEDLRPHLLAQQVANAFGIRVSSMGDDGIHLFPLAEWAVIRVSYAADLTVLDPVGSVRGCMGIHRRNPGSVRLFGDPTLSTIQWSSTSLRSKFYAKGPEIESHHARDAETRERIELLAGQASKVLRFEVTFSRVRALRGLFRLDGTLPSLSLMCEPFVDRWVLEREAIRLRLNEHYESLDRESIGARARHVLAFLDNIQRTMASGGEGLGRRRSLTDERKRDLAFCHFLGSGLGSPAAVATYWGRSRSAVSEMFAELRAIGVPPDASVLSTFGTCVDEIAEQLMPHLLRDDDRVRQLRHREGRNDNFVNAPWSEAVLDEEDHADGDDDQDDGDDGLLAEGGLQALVVAALDATDIGLDDDLPFVAEAG